MNNSNSNSSSKPIGVLMVPFAGSDPDLRTGPPRKPRTAMWERNRPRDRFVSELAVALLRDTPKALKRLGLKGKPHLSPMGYPTSVLVLTATDDQAWYLSDYLVNWRVLHAVPEEDDGGWTLANIDPPRSRIATLAYACRYRPSCDVLVRATAGTGKLIWSYREGRCVLGGKPALIVDIADGTHPGDADDVDIRRKEYAEQGLRVVTANKTTRNAAQ